MTLGGMLLASSTGMSDRVLVVGAGPSGLTAALELSRLGIPVRIIDKLAAPLTTSRAVGVQARTLELLEQRGLSEEMVRLGNPATGGSVYGGGKRMVRLDFSRIESRYHYLLFISQAETERILSTAVEARGVTVERGVELVAVAQTGLLHDSTPVEAVLRHPDGRLEEVKAPWLISAEGAHSTIRETLDLHFQGKTLDEQYALGDLYVDGEIAESDFHIFSSEHGFMALFPLGHKRFRLMADHPMSKPSKDTAPSLEELQAIYSQRSHIPARFRDMGWSSWFVINSRMAKRMRIGRLLLGGDTTHIHSPAGAQGMNTGIQDMINLAWKLALVQNGEARPQLLDTYEQERVPVIRSVLTKTERLTGAIGSVNPVARGLFNHLVPWIGGAGFVQEASTARISQIAVAYRDSPLSTHRGTRAGLHAGDRVPDMPVRYRDADGWQERQLLGLLDPSRFTLLVVRPAESTAARLDVRDAVQPWNRRIGVVELTSPREDETRARFEAVAGGPERVLLVRPDGYVGFASSEHSPVQSLDAYCRQWLSAPERARARAA